MENKLCIYCRYCEKLVYIIISTGVYCKKKAKVCREDYRCRDFEFPEEEAYSTVDNYRGRYED